MEGREPMMPIRDVLLALAVAVVWGINFVFIRWGVNEVPPLLLTALRYVVAAVPAVFFIKRPEASGFQPHSASNDLALAGSKGGGGMVGS